jgi:hypothetical protein
MAWNLLMLVNAASKVSPAQDTLWTWLIPLIVSAIALGGVIATIIVQSVNFKRQLEASHKIKQAELLLAHQLKLAEMRQAWINRLRDALALFHSYAVTPNLDQREKREFYETGTQIQLYMNPSDPNYDALDDLLNGCLCGRPDIDQPYVELSQRILKREWDRLMDDLAKSAAL